MDPTDNPFAPSAGMQPPELAGRDRLLDDARVALARIRKCRPAKSIILLGLRGVGKTVLINKIDEISDEHGYSTIVLESPEDRPIAQMLVPKLRTLLVRLSRIEAAKSIGKQALGMLRAFAAAFKVNVGDVEFGVDAQSGSADSGDLESDLPELLISVASVAKEAGTSVALLIDEVQYLSKQDLSALIASVHRIGQKNLPMLLVGAGLPQLAVLSGEAKSYAERLFEFSNVGPLAEEAAMNAIRTPLKRAEVDITDDALAKIILHTKGYPYFLQEWGHHAWNVARRSPICLPDVEKATIEALARLDNGFFRVRLERLTPRERDYMRAMASLGFGPHRSGDIAQALKMDSAPAGSLRNAIIKKGMIFSPSHGDTAFTVPMFDEFMLRSMPDWTPSLATLPETNSGRKKRR